MLTVVTGWSPKGWHEYGELFLHSFLRYWTDNTRLLVYCEAPFKMPAAAVGRVHPFDLYAIPGARETLARYDNPKNRGLQDNGRWKSKDKLKGYSWRYDAWKFCRQGLIPLAAATHCDPGELLCWLDGDVATTAEVKEDQIERLLPPGYDLAYLGREPKHSEIGFQLYRLPRAVPMLAEFQSLYVTGSVLKLGEHHSAFAFDVARQRSGIRACNLTPGGHGNVWADSPLQRFMTHNKGDRKLAAQRAFYGGKA